jgi:SpoVK/Ycf46/Vps4 family AAA+-type ATPase
MPRSLRILSRKSKSANSRGAPRRKRTLNAAVAAAVPRRTTTSRATRSVGTRILVTAKTPAQRKRLAESVAVELNRKLIRVGLGRTRNRYIGETEKNLRAIFANAESGGAILLLDEADALFGKRTDVDDSNDRYDNQEANYLLERIEQSPAVIILATNSSTEIDPAVLRRMRFSLRLGSPA